MDRFTGGFCLSVVVMLIGSSVVPPVVGHPVIDYDIQSLTCTVYGDMVDSCTLLVSRSEYVRLCDAFTALEMNMTFDQSLLDIFPLYQRLLLCLQECGLVSEQSLDGLRSRYAK